MPASRYRTQETSQKNNIILHPKKLEKETQMKLKGSRRKGITKIKAEINEIATKKTGWDRETQNPAHLAGKRTWVGSVQSDRVGGTWSLSRLLASPGHATLWTCMVTERMLTR